MKRSRSLQSWVQVVGSAGEIVLFFSGYLVALGEFVGAAILLLTRIAIKLAISELMFRRHQAILDEKITEKSP